MKNTLLQEHELRLKMLNDIYGYIEKYNLELTYKDASISYKEDIQNLMDFAVRAETSSIYYLKKKRVEVKTT